MNKYDLIIVGAGPAGLSAALYAGRAKLNTLMLEKGNTGGQIVITHEVANYPGSVHFENKIETSGPALIARMTKQAETFGTTRKKGTVIDIVEDGKMKKVICEDGTEYLAKAVILAPGANPKKLGVPGELELTGKGVSYCATCDADFFEDMQIFVVGGSYSALEEALYLSKYASKVTILVRRDKFRSVGLVEDKVKEAKNIEVWFNTSIKEIHGDGIVESMTLIDNVTKEERLFELPEDDEFGTFGIFPFVGFSPSTKAFEKIVECDEQGYIKTNELMETNIKGIYAAGDCRPKFLRQVVTATADGAIAATAAEKYITEEF